jgi:hypothetical protein
MNDRLVTLLGAAAALLIVIALLFPHGEMTLANVSKPTTIDRGEQGLQGLKDWLDANRMRTLSLRRRYTALQVDPRLPVSGNLIVISAPQMTQPSRRELDALAEWIMQGNFVVLLEARNDRPAWSLFSRSDAGAVARALGVTLAAVRKSVAGAGTRREMSTPDLRPAAAALRGDERQAVSLKPAFAYPLLQHVDSVSTFRSIIHDDPDVSLRGAAGGARQALPLLKRDAQAGFALWEFRSGAGGGWVSSHPDLFGNVTLGLADNARLFANLAGSVLAHDGYIIFDDLHFGVSDLYDPDNFFSDPRLHHTLLWFGVLWLAYVFGYSNRVAPPVRKHVAPRARDFVEAMAGFFARRLNAAAVARAILEHFHADVRGFYRVTDSRAPIGSLLRNDARVRDGDIRELETLARSVDAKRGLDLIRLTRTIDRIKRTLQ